MNTSQITQNNINKKNKQNARTNNAYKFTLYAITAIIVLMILFSLIFVLKNGIATITDNDLSLSQVLFGNQFNPGAGIAAMGFIVVNTIWMSLLAALIATPISIGTSLIITRVLGKKSSAVMFAIVAILAAIPSVVYGSFGYYVIDKFNNENLGFAQGSLFTMIIMLAFMITPTITIMTTASIKLTDVKMENSSLALGATRMQTSFYITLRAAKTGIFTGIMFGVGRCLGESTAITMVGSPSTVLDGITLPIWKQSLFLAPALLVVTSSDTPGPFPIMPLLALFLLLTTTLVFGTMKFYEFTRATETIVKKQSRVLAEERRVLKKLEKLGLKELTSQEQITLINIDRKHKNSIREDEIYSRPEILNQSILQRSTISSNVRYENYKKSKTRTFNVFTYITAAVGIVLLFGIVAFLFNGGFEYLDWTTLTTRGMDWGVYGSSDYLYGLAVPMMGTLISVLISLAIALPIGVILGLCLSTYIDKNTKMGWFISLVFQMLTSIPTIIWSTIAIAVFAGTAINANAITLEPILFLSIIILPSIIKQTEEAGGRVNRNQIEGSYALGATVSYTTRRVYLKEVMPSIISAALLAISIAMAESTIFISILPFTSTPQNISEWLQNGGLTLSTTIFKLKSIDVTTHPEVLPQIKTIGIVLMIFILTTSFISTKVSAGNYLEGFLLAIALILTPCGFYFFNGSVIILLVALLFASFSIIILPTLKVLGNKR